MERRAFLRGGLATALAPGALAWPAAALAATAETAAALPRRRSLAEPVRLSSNENPLGMPESARRAIIDALAGGHRYPGLNATLAARIAGHNGVARESVSLGNGSAEILQMTVQAVAAGGTGVRVVIPDPTFEQVERYAAAMGADVVKVPLRTDHTHDLARMRTLADAGRGPVLVFICNPNNPTGTLTSCDDVAGWVHSAPAHVWFLIDEAYFEFVDDAGYRTFVPDALSRPNVVVSRTFSKIYALAGVRLGYAIAHADTIRRIDGFAAGNNINHLAAAAGLACVDDAAFVRASLQANAQGREFVYVMLRELGLEALPSHANFVLHRVPGDLRTYITRMRDAGVLVGRAFPPMLEYNRVSIGTPDELQRWAGTLRAFRGRGWV
jgi:histidinol-phosphate aminotransferase